MIVRQTSADNLGRYETEVAVLAQKSIDLATARNTSELSANPYQGLQREKTMLAQMLRIVLAYSMVMIALLLFN